MRVFFRHPTRKMTEVPAMVFDTIRVVKSNYAEITGVDWLKQRLFFNGMELAINEKTVDDYGVFFRTWGVVCATSTLPCSAGALQCIVSTFL
jgi:ubiquitin domain-containing protein